ncbi:MAG: TatD family hydrolase [Gammaproteobacteria bacterium]
MYLIDTHCHLDVAEFDADRAQVIAAARAAGVGEVVVPGIFRDEWDAVEALCATDSGLHPALGLHPVYLDRHHERDVAELGRRVERRRPVAVGEIGLDHFVEGLDRARQLALLEGQLQVARDGGICHAFNGSRQQAEQYLARDFKLGFGGMVTYERSSKLRALARDLPLEAIVLETDAPDMTVASHRFERNSPEYLPEVVAAIAGVRGVDAEVVARATTANARAVLGLPARAALPGTPA